MALPSSGQIKMSEINTELGVTSTTANSSLAGQSDGSVATINTNNANPDRPNGAAPHSMSEFFSYNHTLSSGPSAGAYPEQGNQLWTGDQGTAVEVDTVDLSHISYVGESVVGASGQFFFRFDSGTSFRSDAQILSITYNTDDIFQSFSSGVTGIQTTSLTTNTTYNHSSGWIQVSSGTTVGRWNQLNGTPASSGTGVNANALYYESSSSGSNKRVWLRFPSVTFTSNSVTIRSYGYGSNMGTLRFGVYISA